MSLQEQLEKDFLFAFKAKDKVKTAVLRMVKTAVKNKQVELGRPLNDNEVLAVLIKEAKQREDSISQFRKGGREDLALKEEQELEVLQKYLPKPLSREEVEKEVDVAIEKLGVSSLKEMGKVMSYLMQKYTGQIDGKELSQIVRQKLSS
ncbi:GatB/YqeY domain-containing protein [Desulfonauticus submarinus]